MALGGRVAEELVIEDISTGASNDLERVTSIARAMVTKYGMSSKLGPMVFGDSDDEVFLGNSFATKRNYSEEVASEIDKEVRRIVDKAYRECRHILQENMSKLDYVAKALLVYETLDSEQFIKAFNEELSLDVDMNSDDKKVSSNDKEEALTEEVRTIDAEDMKEDNIVELKKDYKDKE